MRKIIATAWISLDGRIAGPNGEIQDWVRPNPDMRDYTLKLIGGIDVLLLGRVTYNDFASYWPHVPDDADEFDHAFAAWANPIRKIVVSGSGAYTPWQNTEHHPGLDRQRIEALRAEEGQDVLLYGSASVVSGLANLGLLDECHLIVHPVVLGAGKPLFHGIDARLDWQPVSATTWETGVTLLKYRR